MKIIKTKVIKIFGIAASVMLLFMALMPMCDAEPPMISSSGNNQFTCEHEKTEDPERDDNSSEDDNSTEIPANDTGIYVPARNVFYRKKVPWWKRVLQIEALKELFNLNKDEKQIYCIGTEL